MFSYCSYVRTPNANESDVSGHSQAATAAALFSDNRLPPSSSDVTCARFFEAHNRPTSSSEMNAVDKSSAVIAPSAGAAASSAIVFLS